MLAPILRTSRAPVQAEFVRVQCCARLLGVSVQTIRNYADDPANGVEVRRTPGNQRLVCLRQIAECFGVDVGGDDGAQAPEEVRQGKINVLYSRCSTRSQVVDKNLLRQAERLRSYVQTNRPTETFIEVSEQASGINSERKGLTKIIDLALAGRLGTLFIEREDRLSRGSYALIARLLAKCGVEIVVTQTGDRESSARTAEEEILFDALSMAYVGQSKLYGKRAHEKTRFVASQAFRDRVVALHGQGTPVTAIFAAIAAEGHRCTNTGKPATLKSVWRVVKDIERGAPNGVPESVRRFVVEACRVVPTGTVLTRDVWASFRRFCDDHGLPCVSRNRLPAFIRSAVPSVQTRLASHHADGFEFVGLALKP